MLPLFLFFSCSTEKRIREAEYKAPEYISAKPVWFNGPERFRTPTKYLDIPPHPFFDLMPYWLPKSSTVSFVMVTPQSSPYLYNFDLKTGKKYLRHKKCAQRDIWKRYKGRIEKSPFSEGFVPRLVDQTGRPQTIYVFGDERYFENQQSSDMAFSERVRVVGGVVVQYCRYYPCKGNRSWKTKLVLIAVNPKDPKFRDIYKIERLRKKTDWNYVRAYIENYRGRKVMASREYPSYRIIGEIPAIKAGQYAFDKGFLFSIDNMNILRKQCYKLYDYMWNHMEKIRNYQPKKGEIEKAIKKMDPIGFYQNDFGANVISDEIKEVENIETKEKLDDKLDFKGDFNRFFGHLMTNYRRQARSCFKYVQSTNLNENYRRHWAFAYIENFFNLHSLEQSYECYRKVWVDNPKLLSGKKQFKEQYNNCTTDAFNRSMERGITRMAVLKKRDSEHYQYIQYDNRVGGTHEKIYSWVYHSGKNLSCVSSKKDKNKKSIYQLVELKEEVFPLDVSWEYFVGDKTSDNDIIIR